MADHLVTPKVTDWTIAIGTIVAAIGSCAGFLALVLEIIRRKRLRFRPPSGLLERLVSMNDSLIEIINNNGQESLWFLQDDRRRNEALLTAISGQIVDEQLHTLVLSLLAGYNECFAWSPGHNMLRERGNSEQIGRQIDAARDAQGKCQMAITRVGELFRLHQE